MFQTVEKAVAPHAHVRYVFCNYSYVYRARLYLRYRTPSPGVRCYQITWQSLNPGLDPTDCFDWSGGGHWYGGGQARNMTWPAELGVVKLSPFITGDVTEQQWGNVLQRYFLNSKGTCRISVYIEESDNFLKMFRSPRTL